MLEDIPVKHLVSHGGVLHRASKDPVYSPLMLSKRAEKAAKEYSKRTPREDLCLAKVTSGDQVRPGPYNLLPILGSVHKGRNQAFVLITTFLLRIADDAHVGVMNWVLPFNERTERTVAKLLVSLGWDGRVWPEEPGWPGTDTKESHGLRSLLAGQNLLATLTFPPDGENGNAIVRQEVLRTSANFPLCPDVPEDEGKEPTPEQIAKLRKLAEDPETIFGSRLVMEN